MKSNDFNKLIRGLRPGDQPCKIKINGETHTVEPPKFKIGSGPCIPLDAIRPPRDGSHLWFPDLPDQSASCGTFASPGPLTHDWSFFGTAPLPSVTERPEVLLREGIRACFTAGVKNERIKEIFDMELVSNIMEA